MKPYDSSSPHTQFTDTEWVFVNQVSGDDSDAWSQNPDIDWKNSVRFKTVGQAFKFAAVRGPNISIMLEIVPSDDNELFKKASQHEYFHVELAEPLTISGCVVKIGARVADEQQRKETCDKYSAALVFDYAGSAETFINAYSTFIQIGSGEKYQSKVSVGLSKIPDSIADYAKLPKRAIPPDIVIPEVEPSFDNLIDKFRAGTYSACLHGMGIRVLPGCKVYFKVDGISQLATFNTDKVETTVVVNKKKQTKLVLPPKTDLLLYGGSILPAPYGITTKKLIELTEKTSPAARPPMKRWYECTKSSNWHGAGASWRLMNMLSPNMPDKVFNQYLSWAIKRGVDHVNVFVTNKADGHETASGVLYCDFSIYGKNFNYPNIDTSYVKKMGDRLDTILDKGLGVVLWMTADDTYWNNPFKTDSRDKSSEIPGLNDPGVFRMLCEDVRSLGWFDKASAAVVGLEVDDYWREETEQNIEILKEVSGLMTGVHFTDDAINVLNSRLTPDVVAAAEASDIVFAQTPPNQKDLIGATVSMVLRTVKKPCNMFEMERHEDRTSCNDAYGCGAYSVGNW